MSMTRLAYRFTWPLAVAALVGLGGAGVHAATGTPAQAGAIPASVKTANARVLVDARGMTLYLYSPDKRDKSVCTGACATYWPPALLSPGQAAPATMAGIAGTFGVTTRADGARQLTYDGAPLYTFVKDKQPGDMTGQGVEGIWWAVVAGGARSGSQGGAPASPVATPTAASGGYYSGGDRHGGGDHQGGHGGGTTGPAASPTPRGYYSGGGDG